MTVIDSTSVGDFRTMMEYAPDDINRAAKAILLFKKEEASSDIAPEVNPLIAQVVGKVFNPSDDLKEESRVAGYEEGKEWLYAAKTLIEKRDELRELASRLASCDESTLIEIAGKINSIAQVSFLMDTNPSLLPYMKEDLRNNPELVAKLASSDQALKNLGKPEALACIEKGFHGVSLYDASLLQDEEVAIALVQKSPLEFQNLSDEVKDKPAVLAAYKAAVVKGYVVSDPRAKLPGVSLMFAHASDWERAHPKIILAALKESFANLFKVKVIPGENIFAITGAVCLAVFFRVTSLFLKKS